MISNMKKNKETIVIDLGGSIIVSRSIQTRFLARFRSMLLPLLKERRFIVVTGGGSTARNYQQAASAIHAVTDEDKDWLGLHATRLNAHLLRTIFAKEAYPVIFDNPLRPISKSDWASHSLFIGAGWKPGWSTDYVSVLLANRFHASKMIIATKIPYVYDADIAKYKNAKPLPDITWKTYRKMVGDKWTPGMKTPVDPVAARFAQEKGMEAIIVRGTDLKNLHNSIFGKPFRGTRIHS